MNLQISYNWLKEYLKTKKSAADFAALLSLKGPTVDRIYEVKPAFSQVVTGKILEIKKHPNADKLQITQTDVGSAGGILNIVCGAANIAVGQKVPVAMIGAVLPGDFKIEKREVRGVVSQGMLCSAKELGFGDDHSGIFILPPDTTVGAPLEKILLLDDHILDIEVTANRPDAMCVVGLAREAGAILEEKFLYKQPTPRLVSENILPLAIEVKEPALCQRYQAIVLTGVKVSDSPLWMQQRLLASGLRPINNLVDITNYVLLEYGQPLHVFDYDKLKNQKIIVRKAKAGEKILALDGKEYELSENNLIIADGERPAAVAGVMGGELTAAQNQTVNIVLESANFNQVSVRKTARALNLHSESSDLFEKGLSPDNTTPAILRAIELVQQLAEGKTASEVFDVYQQSPQKQTIELTALGIKRCLGINPGAAKVKNILTALGFGVENTKESFKVTVPYWRQNDISGEHDLIEEVARIYGYNTLPNVIPQGQIPIVTKDPNLYWEKIIKEILVGLGYTECYSYSLISEELLKKIGIKPSGCLPVNNPLSQEYVYLRPTLSASLLQIALENEANFPQLRIFELANIYPWTKRNDLPDEQSSLVLLQTGTDGKELFYNVKGQLANLFSRLNLNVEYSPLSQDQTDQIWHPTRSADIIYQGQKIARLGQILEETLQKFGLKNKIVLAEFDLVQMLKLASSNKSYVVLPKFPEISLDLAVVLPRVTLWKDIEKVVLGLNKLIVQVELFDQFTGQGIPEGKKSIAFRMVFRHPDRTLKSEEAELIKQEVVKLIQTQFGAEVRS